MRRTSLALIALLALAPTFNGIEHEVYEVPEIGKFYIDGPKDRVRRTIIEGKVWEPKIVEQLRKYLSMDCLAIDVGAHIGVHTVLMARLSGRVVSFEPQQKLHLDLMRNLHLNGLANVTPLRYAVWDENTLLEMEPTKENPGSTAIGSGGEAVVARTLDSFHFEYVCLIKIDAEGSTPEVLKGAEVTILRDRPVLVLEVGGWIRKSTWELLERFEYVLYPLGAHDFLALPE